jgi:hypothetical protein
MTIYFPPLAAVAIHIQVLRTFVLSILISSACSDGYSYLSPSDYVVMSTVCFHRLQRWLLTFKPFGLLTGAFPEFPNNIESKA